jgi:ubiquitin-protein ligase
MAKEELGGTIEVDSKRTLSTAGKRKHAIKRLHMDLQEVILNPLPTVSAGPVDDSNMFLWHGNIAGVEGTPYEGVVFHVTMTFPQTYPYDAPRVELCTSIVHPNIFGKWICLDMLENEWWVDHAGQKKSDKGVGWSSGYSVQSILVQLQALLMDAASTNKLAVDLAINSSHNFRCSCGHHPGKCWPPFRKEGDVSTEVVALHRRTMNVLTADMNTTMCAAGSASSSTAAADIAAHNDKEAVKAARTDIGAPTTVACDAPTPGSTAATFYMIAMRPVVASKNKGMPDAEVMRTVEKMWEVLSEEAKEPYKECERRDHQRYLDEAENLNYTVSAVACGTCGSSNFHYNPRMKCSLCTVVHHRNCLNIGANRAAGDGLQRVCSTCRGCFKGNGSSAATQEGVEWSARLIDGAAAGGRAQGAQTVACAPTVRKADFDKYGRWIGGKQQAAAKASLSAKGTRKTKLTTKLKNSNRKNAAKNEQEDLWKAGRKLAKANAGAAAGVATAGAATGTTASAPKLEVGMKLSNVKISSINTTGDATLTLTPMATTPAVTVLLPANEMQMVNWNKNKTEVLGLIRNPSLVVGAVLPTVYVTNVHTGTRNGACQLVMVSKSMRKSQSKMGRGHKGSNSNRNRNSDSGGAVVAPVTTADLEASMVSGTKVEGVVVKVLDFGAFVNVGWHPASRRVDGLIHCSQVREGVRLDAHDMANKPALNVGKSVSVWVKSVGVPDEPAKASDKPKLGLTLIEPPPKPIPRTLEELEALVGTEEGESIVGIIRRLDNDLGAFVDIGCKPVIKPAVKTSKTVEAAIVATVGAATGGAAVDDVSDDGSDDTSVASGIPDDFLCPITLELMQDPVISADGHSYERSAIEGWLATHDTSPKTNEQLDHTELVPNHNLRQALDNFVTTGIDTVPAFRTCDYCEDENSCADLIRVDPDCPQCRYCTECWAYYDAETTEAPTAPASVVGGATAAPRRRDRSAEGPLGLCHMNQLRKTLMGSGVPHFWSIRQALAEHQTVIMKVKRVDVGKRRLALELVSVWSSSAEATTAATEAATEAAAGTVATSTEQEQELERDYEWRMSSPFAKVSDDILRRIYTFVAGDVSSAATSSAYYDRKESILRENGAFASTCRLFAQVVGQGRVVANTVSELVCYHSKVPFAEDTLGVGINLEHYPVDKGSYHKNPVAKLAYAHASLDLVSYGAFHHQKVRQNVMKEPFNYWLPLYLNASHGARSITEAKESITIMCTPEWAHDEELVRKRREAKDDRRRRFCPKYGLRIKQGERNAELAMTAAAAGRGALEFKPEMVLDVLPKLMNTMVVSMMKGDMHASMVALEGYMAIYHLLLAFIERYPCLRETIDTKLDDFMAGERGRNKRAVPSLGDLLPLLAVTDKYTWPEVAHTVLTEVFDRNAKWVLEKHPELADVCKELRRGQVVSSQRLGHSFQSNAVSIKIILFHVAFLKLFRPTITVTGEDGTKKVMMRPIAETKVALDSSLGRPTPALQQAMQARCKIIMRVKKWHQFFEGVGLAAPDDAFLSHWLRQSIINSGRRRYHNQQGLVMHLEEADDMLHSARVARKAAKNARRQQETEHAGDNEDLASQFDLLATASRSSRW